MIDFILQDWYNNACTEDFLKMKKILISLLALFILVLGMGTVTVHAEEDDTITRYRGVATERVNVRTGPGEEYDKVPLEGDETLQLTPQEEVVIIGEAMSSKGKVWYQLIATRNGKEYTGYSTSSYVSKQEEITPEPTPEPTEEPTKAPTPTLEPTKAADPTPTQPLVSSDDTPPNDKDGIMTVILIVVIVGVVALIGLLVFKLLSSRQNNGNTTSRKLDLLKKVHLDGDNGNNNGRKLPQIKKSDIDRAVREDVRSDVYYRNSYNDEYTEGVNANMQADSDEKRALREAIERLQEHDIVYHTIYGEGEVYDNSDVKLIEVRFGNDMRFLKKEQLVAKRELKIIDEEDQSIARRRNRRRNNNRR